MTLRTTYICNICGTSHTVGDTDNSILNIRSVYFLDNMNNFEFRDAKSSGNVHICLRCIKNLTVAANHINIKP